MEGEEEEEAEEIEEEEEEENNLGRDMCNEKEFPELENRSQECKDGKGESTKKKKSRRKKERT